MGQVTNYLFSKVYDVKFVQLILVLKYTLISFSGTYSHAQSEGIVRLLKTGRSNYQLL